LVAKGYGRFCSVVCGRRASRKGKYVMCEVCGKEVYRAPERLQRASSMKYFCTKSCQAVWKNSLKLGDQHPNWKGGAYAYRNLIKRSKIPMICGLCSISDHRILAVHHIDHDHSNNDPKNLSWLCHNCHHLVHHDTVERQRFQDNILKNLKR